MPHTFNAAEKARIALEAFRGADPISQIASAHEAHPIQVGLWKKTLLEKAGTIFDHERSEMRRVKELEDTVDELHRIIGQRDAELAWLKKKCPS